jgi:hypothetical protein
MSWCCDDRMNPPSYRNYVIQVPVFKTVPNRAVTTGMGQRAGPWTSAEEFRTLVWRPMSASSRTWPGTDDTHPNWAEPDGRRPEAWHWEFAG